MVSHSSHPVIVVNELLILVIRIASFSITVAVFVIYREILMMMLLIERSFLILKILKIRKVFIL